MRLLFSLSFRHLTARCCAPHLMRDGKHPRSSHAVWCDDDSSTNTRPSIYISIESSSVLTFKATTTRSFTSSATKKTTSLILVQPRQPRPAPSLPFICLFAEFSSLPNFPFFDPVVVYLFPCELCYREPSPCAITLSSDTPLISPSLLSWTFGIFTFLSFLARFPLHRFM